MTVGVFDSWRTRSESRSRTTTDVAEPGAGIWEDLYRSEDLVPEISTVPSPLPKSSNGPDDWLDTVRSAWQEPQGNPMDGRSSRTQLGANPPARQRAVQADELRNEDPAEPPPGSVELAELERLNRAFPAQSTVPRRSLFDPSRPAEHKTPPSKPEAVRDALTGLQSAADRAKEHRSSPLNSSNPGSDTDSLQVPGQLADGNLTVVLERPNQRPSVDDALLGRQNPGTKRRGRHAKPQRVADPVEPDLRGDHRAELLELTDGGTGWHHRQSEQRPDVAGEPGPRYKPRHAAPRQEQSMESVEDAARSEDEPMNESGGSWAARSQADSVGEVIEQRGDEPVSRETSDGHEPPIASITKAALDTITGRAPKMPRPLKPRTLVVANQKGGVGKTTTTVNLAAALATYGCRVLVIDLDPQGNASTALGVDHFAGVPSVYEVIIEGKPLADIVRPAEGIEGLFCAPATIDLAGAEIELVSLVARESRLARSLSAFDEYFDYILIDCPPSLGLLTVNALVAAEEVLIPIQCEYYALEGLGQLLKNVDLVKAHLNPKLHVSTILLTMFDGRTRLAAQVADEVRQHFENIVLKTTIPRSVRISEAPSYGQTVITYDPVSTGALSYVDAAREFAIRGANPTGIPGQNTSWETQ